LIVDARALTVAAWPGLVTGDRRVNTVRPRMTKGGPGHDAGAVCVLVSISARPVTAGWLRVGGRGGKHPGVTAGALIETAGVSISARPVTAGCF
jgi:hypothetical protein